MRQQSVYKVIQKCHELYGYPIEMSCKLLHVARSAYHKWASGKLSQRTLENQRLAEKIEHIHSQNPDKGYRRINDDLLHDHGIHVNDKIAHCIDNGPMEGFWGILKRERYYGRRFTSKQELTQMIVNYIRYYNNRRVQRSLGILTPMEKQELYLAA